MRSEQTTEMLVSDIHPFFNELIGALNSSRNIINVDQEEIRKLYGWMDIIKNKRAADKVNRDDEKQLLLDVQIAYDKVNKLLSK